MQSLVIKLRYALVYMQKTGLNTQQYDYYEISIRLALILTSGEV